MVARQTLETNEDIDARFNRFFENNQLTYLNLRINPRMDLKTLYPITAASTKPNPLLNELNKEFVK